MLGSAYWAIIVQKPQKQQRQQHHHHQQQITTETTWNNKSNTKDKLATKTIREAAAAARSKASQFPPSMGNVMNPHGSTGNGPWKCQDLCQVHQALTGSCLVYGLDFLRVTGGILGWFDFASWAQNHLYTPPLFSIIPLAPWICTIKVPYKQQTCSSFGRILQRYFEETYRPKFQSI